jgi:chorismate dehydratase
MNHRKIRVGAVNYLNTKPLVYDLPRLAPSVELMFDYPSRLGELLARGDLDVALIPSIDYLTHRDYAIVSDACIASRGPVMSVKVFFRVPPGKVRTLALDAGSHTSAVLAQILLQEQHQVRPELVPLALGKSLDDSPADAVLLIGDRAIQSPAGRFTEVWDLGDVWCRWTELPFVFAMWVARADTDLGGLDVALAAARDLGVRNIGSIADREAAPLGLTRPQCIAYLRDNLHFHLGPRERRGLALFQQKAAATGLCETRVARPTTPFADSGRATPVISH